MNAKILMPLALFTLISFTGCQADRSSNSSYLAISVHFPKRGEVRSQAIDPRAYCASVKLSTPDGTEAGALALDISSPQGTIRNLNPGIYYLEVDLTDGIKAGYECTGRSIDYLRLRADLKGGPNTAILTLPRGKWVFDSPINLNATEATTESINAFYLIPGVPRSSGKDYDYYQAVFVGSNLPLGECTYSKYCSTRVETNGSFTGPDQTVIRVGAELTGIEQDFIGWVSLQSGAKGPRYFGIVSSPPCTYKRPDSLISCTYSISDPTLNSYMETRIANDGSISGYIWEVHLDSASTTRSIQCFSDLNMTSPVGCPSELTSDPKVFEAKAYKTTSKSIRVSQTIFNNVSLDVSKKYKFVDSSGTTYYVQDDRHMVFDVAVHPFRATQQRLQENIMLSNLFYLTYDTSLNLTGIIPVAYDLTKGTNLITTPPGPTAKVFLVPHSGGVNFYTKTYGGSFPKELIYFDGSVFSKYIAYDLSIPPAQISTYNASTSPTGPLCELRVVYEPMNGIAHIFLREQGASSGCYPVDSANNAFYYIRSDMTSSDPPINISSVAPFGSLIDDGGIQLHILGGSVSHFIGHDYNGTLYICPSSFTSPCITQAWTTLEFVGYSYDSNLSFFLIDNYLWYFDGTNPTNTGRSAYVCANGEDATYCIWSDTTTLKTEVFKFDHASKNIVPIGTTQTYFDMSFGPEIVLMGNYALISGYDYAANKWFYEAVHRYNGSTVPINAPSGRDPYIGIGSPYAAYGTDYASGDFCYINASTLPNITCIGNSSFTGILKAEQGPFVDVINQGPYLRTITKVFIQEGCNRISPDAPCAGGTLYSYSPDMTGRRAVLSLGNDESVIEVTGYGNIVLINTANPSGENIYAADLISGNVAKLESGGDYSIVSPR